MVEKARTPAGAGQEASINDGIKHVLSVHQGVAENHGEALKTTPCALLSRDGRARECVHEALAFEMIEEWRLSRVQRQQVGELFLHKPDPPREGD